MAQSLERRKVDEIGHWRAQRRESGERIDRQQAQRVGGGQVGHSPELTNGVCQ
jgi:hypothetical protein